VSVPRTAGLDVTGPVQAEVLVLSLAGGGIAVGGPCGPGPWYLNVDAGDDPLALATATVARNLTEPLLVHSTSWRRHRDAVVLTFIAVLSSQTAAPPAARPVRRTPLARGSALAAPADVAVDQVVEHGLRHLAWLIADDPHVAERLAGEWSGALAAYRPEPFREFVRAEDPMQLEVRCDCGWQARGSEDEVVEAATEHGRRAHNMTASREQILAMATPAAEAE